MPNRDFDLFIIGAGSGGVRAARIAAEVDARLEEGFRTLKVKVGKDVDADLARVALVQEAAGGRA